MRWWWIAARASNGAVIHGRRLKFQDRLPDCQATIMDARLSWASVGVAWVIQRIPSGRPTKKIWSRSSTELMTKFHGILA